MKVNTFVKKVKEGQFNNAADMIKVWYIPIQTKHDIALRVLKKCSADNNGYFYVDDFEKNIYFSMLMFNAYTGVEISEDFETLLKEYDMLCSNDILDTVEQLCRKDHNHVEEVLHYEEKKLMRQNSIEASFAQIANGISSSLTTLADALAKKVDGFDINSILPEGADIDELLSTLDKLK